jgi:hypothetical protein
VKKNVAMSTPIALARTETERKRNAKRRIVREESNGEFFSQEISTRGMRHGFLKPTAKMSSASRDDLLARAALIP